MTNPTVPVQDILPRLRKQWVKLTEEDVRQGLKHRDSLLERLRHRHNLGLDEAEAQLRAFERSNPGSFFEKS
jgi:hypothetical protein